MVTSILKDVDFRYIGTPTVTVGEENAAATSEIGLILRDPGFQLVPSMDSAELLTVDSDFPVADDVTTRRADVNVSLIQQQVELIAMSLGETESGQVLEVGGAVTVQRRFSVQFTGTVAGGELKTFYAPSVTVVSNPTLDFSPAGHTVNAVTFKVLKHPDNSFAWRWTDGAGNVVATIASGVLTRVLNTPTTEHKVASEVGGSADILDTITAGDLVDLEILTLRINSVDEPITLTHNSGPGGPKEMILLDAADSVMAALADWSEFQYTLSTDDWTETARYRA